MENDKKPALIPHKNCPLNHPLFSSLSACTFRIMILHQQPLRTIYDTLLLTNSTPLTAITNLWCTSNHVPNWWFYFLFNRKYYNPLLLLCPPLSHLTSRTPTKSNLYLTNSLAVSQPPLGWIKVCCYAEVTGISQEDKQLFLPSVAAYSWCMCVACHTHTHQQYYGYRLTIGYFVVVKGRGWELSEFPWWFRGTRFVTRYFGLLYEKSPLVWLASRWGETDARISPWGYADARHMSRR